MANFPKKPIWEAFWVLFAEIWEKMNFPEKNGTAKKNFTLWSFSMDGIQLSQGYTTTMTSQLPFYHQASRRSWYSFDPPQKDKRLS